MIKKIFTFLILMVVLSAPLGSNAASSYSNYGDFYNGSFLLLSYSSSARYRMNNDQSRAYVDLSLGLYWNNSLPFSKRSTIQVNITWLDYYWMSIGYSSDAGPTLYDDPRYYMNTLSYEDEYKRIRRADISFTVTTAYGSFYDYAHIGYF